MVQITSVIPLLRRNQHTGIHKQISTVYAFVLHLTFQTIIQIRIQVIRTVTKVTSASFLSLDTTI